MGERLAGGDVAFALFGYTLATGAGLVVLITMFGPLSGAHFDPAVTLVFAVRRELSGGTAAAYIAAQVASAVAEAVLQVSTKLRDGPAQAFSEASPPSG